MLFTYVTFDSKSLFRKVVDGSVLFWFDITVCTSTGDRILSLSVENKVLEVVVSIFSGTLEDTKLNNNTNSTNSTNTMFIIFKFALLNVKH